MSLLQIALMSSIQRDRATAGADPLLLLLPPLPASPVAANRVASASMRWSRGAAEGTSRTAAGGPAAAPRCRSAAASSA